MVAVPAVIRILTRTDAHSVADDHCDVAVRAASGSMSSSMRCAGIIACLPVPTSCPQSQLSPVIAGDEIPLLMRLFGVLCWVSGVFNPDRASYLLNPV